jgi:hypothetical protein
VGSLPRSTAWLASALSPYSRASLVRARSDRIRSTARPAPRRARGSLPPGRVRSVAVRGIPCFSRRAPRDDQPGDCSLRLQTVVPRRGGRRPGLVRSEATQKMLHGHQRAPERRSRRFSARDLTASEDRIQRIASLKTGQVSSSHGWAVRSVSDHSLRQPRRSEWT